MSEMFPCSLYLLSRAIEEKNASLVTFLTREVLENLDTYTSAFNALSNTNLITVVYYILAGAQNPFSGFVSNKDLH